MSSCLPSLFLENHEAVYRRRDQGQLIEEEKGFRCAESVPTDRFEPGLTELEGTSGYCFQKSASEPY